MGDVKQVDWFNEHWYLITEGENQVFFPSVTTKLGASPKPFLAKWRGDIGNREADLRMNEAGQRGTRIHYAWYVIASGGIVLFQPFNRPNYTAEEIASFKEEYNELGREVFILQNQDEMYALYKMQKWAEIVQPKIIERETIVYSIADKCAGTMDNLMFIKKGSYVINGRFPLELPEGNYVVDLKSGNSIDEDDAPAQCAAYAHCYTEMTGTEIIGTLIIHTSAATRTGIEGLATLYSDKDEMKKNYDFYKDVSRVWEKKFSDSKPKLFKFPALIKL